MSRFTLALLICTVWASAQPRAALTGNVHDASDSAVPGVTVTAWNEETGLRRGTQTGSDGRYHIDSLPAGIYKVSVRRSGFQTQVRLGVDLQPESNALDFVLQVGSIHEVLTIRGAPPSLNTSDASVALTVNRGFAETLPLNGRGILSLIELAPGVVTTPATLGEAGQFSVSGQRQNANALDVDGVSVNSGVSGSGLPAQFSGGTLPLMTAFGSTHTLASTGEIEEVRVDTSSFAPEYGRMPGGHISLTTRSGTEQFHGSVFTSLRNAVFDANDPFANGRGLNRANSRLGDWGGTVGGPILKNRTFFFASYESLRLDEPYSLNAVVPPVAARTQAPSYLQPLLAGYPVPNTGPNLFSATFTRPASLDSGTFRIDHSVTSQMSLFLRVTQSPSSADSGFAEVDHSQFSTGGFTLGLTAFPSATLVNDARLHISRVGVSSEWSFTGAGGAQPVNLATTLYSPQAAASPGAALYGFAIGGFGAIYSGTSSPSRQGQVELGDTLSWTRGSHSLRLGLDYERLTPGRDDIANAVSGTFWSLNDLLTGLPMSIDTSQGQQASSLIETLSSFAQDTWRIAPRLTVTFGVRWELTPSPSLRGGIAPATSTAAPTGGAGVAPPGFPSSPPGGPGLPPISPITPPGISPTLPATAFTALWPTRYTQLAPRIGAAYKLSPNTVVRAGWGIFYDVAFSVATDPINGFPYNRWQFSSVFGIGGAAPVTNLPPTGTTYTPGLHLPYAEEWNVSVEHLFPRVGTLAASYLGSHGVDGLRREGAAAPPSRLINSLVSTNDGFSHFQALELDYRRNLAAGISSTVAYTYSHSTDNGSWDNAVYYTQGAWTPQSDRGSSSYDVRHNFTASLVWQRKEWKLAAIGRARSGFPIDVLTTENLLGLSFDDATRPDLVSGVPIWIDDPHVLGGRRLNPAAFATPAASLQGSLGRNTIDGFGFYQIDLSVSRGFALGSHARFDLRADAFNILNHAMPGDPVPYLDSPLFGTSNAGLNSVLGTGSPHSGLAPSLQMGSPRIFEFTLRFSF